MGYLDRSTITVDAILTNRGRELLAQGTGPGEFQITKFALADDEVDYRLYNTAHPLGSEYYGSIIENMPVLEATPDDAQLMKYKLVTVGSTAVRGPGGSYIVPRVVSGLSSNTQNIYQTPSAGSSTQPTFIDVDPQTSYGTTNNKETGKYTLVVGDSSLVTMVANAAFGTDSVRISTRGSIVAKGNKFRIERNTTTGKTGTTTVTVYGNDSGATFSFTLVIN
jgi:hypothetical protein